MTVRTFLIITFLVLVVGLSSFGVYWLYFRNTSSNDLEVTETGDTSNPFPIIPGQPISQNQAGSKLGGVGAVGSGTSTAGVGQLSGTPGDSIRTVGNLSIIGTGPVAGATVVTHGTKKAVRYIDQQSGHLFELEDGETIATKLSNTTIPKIQSVLWNDTGNSLVTRAFADIFNTVETNIQKLRIASSTTGTADVGSLEAIPLPATTVDVAVSPDRKSLFYLNAVGDGVVGVTADFDNKKTSQIFDSLLTEWTAEWPAQGTVALTPKASQKAMGALYLIDTTKKTQTKLLAGTRGLTALVNPSKTSVLYTTSTETGLLTSVLDIASRSSSLFAETTLPEKCVWSSIDRRIVYCAVPTNVFAGTYPDDWYSGVVRFTDRIELIDIESGTTIILLDRNTPGISGGIDAIHLMLDHDEKNLYFLNKTDGTLYKLDIAQAEIGD